MEYTTMEYLLLLMIDCDVENMYDYTTVKSVSKSLQNNTDPTISSARMKGLIVTSNTVRGKDTHIAMTSKGVEVCIARKKQLNLKV